MSIKENINNLLALKNQLPVSFNFDIFKVILLFFLIIYISNQHPVEKD